ncbi:NAD(P)H-binding protein [Conexibacter woesei]|uniref:NmrA family protein n=1 Tax=Conexibacter woesei (strain DSM 14684 / CCUG 47730 / CIP 108061 / JCM 11494 / NBRC 100937 / ID131577) TaxID=469383 RepID=D3F1V5_CONWI|nr:NAD(P)H-binding protein [Conexibacter woesei]ADB54136.1 NmrA family protein [Conexibacter woesei DSM 14684]
MTSNRRSILVLGATGKTGSRVVSQLRQHDVEVRAASRNGATRFDWGDEGTWAPALDGAGAAYVVVPEEVDGAERVSAFGALAAARGVERLVLLSARDWANSGGEAELASERAVQGAGTAWTILRPTWFAQNFSEAPWLRDPVLGGEVVLSTGQGLEPFIDADDIAAVAVAALTEDGHAGETYELSGPRLLTFGDAVAEIAAASGRDVRYVPVDQAAFAAYAAEHGAPPETIEVLNALYGWIAEGREAHLSDGVQRALGREPRDFSDYVKAAAASGAWRD